MKGKLFAIWDKLRSSYWFIPTLMTLLAFGLSFVLVSVDDSLGQRWARGIDFLQANRPDGARALLQTVAGSMIGVAGVTFSITIASVVYASGQYGPRLLTNFMRDTGNQITLGTFIATFIYCVMVLRAVHSADEGGASAAAAAASAAADAGDLASGLFVPHLAILAAVILALASIAVFIYFIHHVPHSIHVSNVIAGIGRELERRVDRVFPERIGEERGGAEAAADDTGGGAAVTMPPAFYVESRPVTSEVTGYLQSIDHDALLEAARARSVALRLRFRPGDFVRHHDTLALVMPGEEVDDALIADVRFAFNWGTQRTALQDLRFLVNELVEIAARALSPGVNDPFTAMSCLDWLGATVARLGGRQMPAAFRRDERGAVRVIARPTRFAELVEAAFGQLRPYVSADRNAFFHALETLAALTPHLRHEAQRRAVREEADALIAAARQNELGGADLEEASRRYDVLTKLLGGELAYEQTAAESSWLGGTA